MYIYIYTCVFIFHTYIYIYYPFLSSLKNIGMYPYFFKATGNMWVFSRSFKGFKLRGQTLTNRKRLKPASNLGMIPCNSSDPKWGSPITNIPIGSMGLVYLPIYIYIYHNYLSYKLTIHVGKYTIHGSYGIDTPVYG